MKFKTLETKRFILSAFKMSDVPCLVRICSNVQVNEFLMKIPTPYTEADAEAFVNLATKEWASGSNLRWAVRYKNAGEGGDNAPRSVPHQWSPVIGSVELRKDQGLDSIGVWIDPQTHAKGVALESVSAMIKYALETNYTKDGVIGYSHHVDNVKSQKLASRLGFKLAGRFNSEQIGVKDRNGKYYDYLSYKLPQTIGTRRNIDAQLAR
ncbi:MAG: GNAT family N-acetyltransferase [Candidatus Ancillula sp.]|jgi:RimJ/RimL family protein N-acetyltransferase|nr:GNAT family N-acetyltransferase [Candidatus Ancillula sp.]